MKIKEFLVKRGFLNKTHLLIVPEWLEDYSKYLIEETLKEAAEKATCIKYFEPENGLQYDENDKVIWNEDDEEAHYHFPVSCGGKWADLNKESILNLQKQLEERLL